MSDRKTFEAFLDQSDLSRPVVLHDGDVDGLGAAVVVGDRLSSETVFLTPPKGENAFTDSMAERLRKLDPSALFVLDLGIRDFDLLPGIPYLFMDHHRPEGLPKGTVISGYGRDPVPTTSLLAWHAAGTPENAWKAAIGNVGDLGPTDPELDVARRGQTIKRFDAAKSLLNSAKRSSDPDAAVPAALRLFQRSQSAQEVIEADDEDALRLRSFHEEVKRELAESRRAAPVFATKEPIAMLRFDSPCRVHPLLAQSWKGRLPKYVIMAANGKFRPGYVSFSMRTDAEINILDLLARHKPSLGVDTPEYGLGHDQASGGSLLLEVFDRFCESVGLPIPARPQ
ncbi:hypothetical protein EON81_19095 [bacterium]|nr:MAG: hypothetical protein EON81_19095 [bacterium]